ncbi:MAG: nucleoside kinase [Candidatus Eremiobacterota bacterium]
MKIAVEFAGQTYHVPEGTTISEVLGQIYVEEHRVLGATLNNHLVSLDTRIDGDATVVAVTPHMREGQEILRRTAAHMLHYVCRKHYPEVRFTVGQSLMGGYFYEVKPTADLEALAGRLTQLMEELAEADLPFNRRRISVEAVGRHLEDPEGYKAGLLRAWAAPVVYVIGLDGFSDIQYGPYAPSTSHCRGCRVVAFPPGLILHFPEQVVTSPAQGSTHLFQAYREARGWNKLIGVASVGDLNAATLEDRVGDVIRIAEGLHEKKIASIADQVAAQPETRLVCIAGPSSSGKTTFVRRLAVQLQVNGLRPILIGMDDYYRGRAETPRDEHGDYDFEALEALDLALLERHLEQLVAGEEVSLPRFDFALGERLDTGKPVRLGSKDVLVMEGIHGLNPSIAPRVPRFRVFISALTQLIIDEHNRIFTSDARLLRRLVRDRRYRGTSAADTIARWPKVRRGEERWIFPYQEQADAIFNSTLVYEAAVLKPFAWRFLLEVPRSHPSRVRAYELLRFLDLFVPVFPDSVPANSVLREFIGGSGFDY